MLNRTFRVGQGARNGTLTPYLLVNFDWATCSEVAELLEHCLGQGMGSKKWIKDNRMWGFSHHQEEHPAISCHPYSRQTCRSATCQETWPGPPIHPALWVPLLLTVEVANATPWHFMLKQTWKQQDLSHYIIGCLVWHVCLMPHRGQGFAFKCKNTPKTPWHWAFKTPIHFPTLSLSQQKKLLKK